MERSLNSIAENLRRIRAEIEEAAVGCGREPGDIRLMAVTKTQPPELVNAAIAQGIDLLGENRAQEMAEKYDAYHKDGVEIHFIGHLQTNKVKLVAGRVSMVQSVDSLRLAEELSEKSRQLGCATELLLEVNIGGEASKGGVAPVGAEELARQVAELPAVKLRGLMAIPPICDNPLQIERYFFAMRALLVDIQGKNIDNISMDVLSMGMSDDYIYAVRHGSTLVRLGSAIFGSRRN